MPVQLNHTIVQSRDKHASAEFLSRILGFEPPRMVAHFVQVRVANDVALDFDDAAEISPQHYAFLVSEEEFDPIFERIKSEGVEYWADPQHKMPGQLNSMKNGRGFYFNDPSGHNMEVIYRPNWS